MLIRASRQERCKISPQRGFCVLGEGGRAGGAPSIHLPPFPPCFVSESRRCGGCEDPGALNSFQRGRATGSCRPTARTRGGLRVLGGDRTQAVEVMERAASLIPAWQGAEDTGQPGLGSAQGTARVFQHHSPSSTPLWLLAGVGMRDTLGAACPGRAEGAWQRKGRGTPSLGTPARGDARGTGGSDI